MNPLLPDVCNGQKVMLDPFPVIAPSMPIGTLMLLPSHTLASYITTPPSHPLSSLHSHTLVSPSLVAPPPKKVVSPDNLAGGRTFITKARLHLLTLMCLFGSTFKLQAYVVGYRSALHVYSVLCCTRMDTQ